MLVVDDDADTVEVLRCFLAAKGLRVHVLVHSQDYARDIARERPRLLLLDMMLGSKSGIEAWQRAVALSPGWCCKAYLMTAAPLADPARLAGTCGAAGVLAKPFDMDVLLDLVDEAIGEKRKG